LNFEIPYFACAYEVIFFGDFQSLLSHSFALQIGLLNLENEEFARSVIERTRTNLQARKPQFCSLCKNDWIDNCIVDIVPVSSPFRAMLCFRF